MSAVDTVDSRSRQPRSRSLGVNEEKGWGGHPHPSCRACPFPRCEEPCGHILSPGDDTGLSPQVARQSLTMFVLIMNGCHIEIDAHRLNDGGLLLSYNGNSYTTYLKEEVDRCTGAGAQRGHRGPRRAGCAQGVQTAELACAQVRGLWTRPSLGSPRVPGEGPLWPGIHATARLSGRAPRRGAPS